MSHRYMSKYTHAHTLSYVQIYILLQSLPAVCQSRATSQASVAAETEEQVAENVGTHSDTSMKVVTLRK